MWQELQTPDPDPQADMGGLALEPQTKTLRQAVCQIVIADVSMSLDNVLAVAGAAREHPWVLIFGLMLSIVLMGAAATYIAKLLQKHRWIGWVGLLIIVAVALRMIWHGGHEVFAASLH
jgi:predicted tellurium resistance membrane protein TerC